MVDQKPSGKRAVARCDALGQAPFSDEPDLLFRAFLTPAYNTTLKHVAKWMTEAGMAARIDAAGNLVGRYEGLEPDAPALMIGSHLDSVRDAGRYDGPLGVMLGIECVDALNRAGKRLPFAIEVIAFGDEEGSRFPASMLCSRAVAGTLRQDEVEGEDRDGISLATALEKAGLEAGRFLEAARPAGSVIAYLEAHIEQGPMLQARDLPVGTVTAFAGQRRYRVVATGRAGHAGTTAMSLRKDALAATAEAILAVEQVAVAGPEDLVATVGTMKVEPGAINVIPGRVEFTIDIRAGDAETRDQAAKDIFARLDLISAVRNISFETTPLQEIMPCPCAPELMSILDRSIESAGVSPMRLVSGAGHDAMSMAAICPVAMLFVRCRDGISHNPAEHVEANDVEVAFQVMQGFIERLADSALAAGAAKHDHTDGEQLEA
jgi:allantoate deiminase